MFIANEKLRARLEEAMKAATTCPDCSNEIHELAQKWLENKEDAVITREIADTIVPLCEACNCNTCKTILDMKHYIVKRSQWIIGGDGASYDIGFGGLDHVLASGKNVNLLVLDTEVYSNTGGQASKATPLGAIAKFAASGKRIRKKTSALSPAPMATFMQHRWLWAQTRLRPSKLSAKQKLMTARLSS